MGLPITPEDIAALSIDERIELVGTIWDSIAAEADHFEMTVELRQELDRRIAEADASPDDGIPWEVVKARALARARQ